MDDDVRRFLDTFAAALVEGAYARASGLLAPWLSPGEEQLRSEVRAQEAATRQEWADRAIGPADGHRLDENPLSASELREEWVPLPDEISDQNFVQWCCVTVEADEGEWALYDLWCAVVRFAGELRIGYYEAGPPD